MIRDTSMTSPSSIRPNAYPKGEMRYTAAAGSNSFSLNGTRGSSISLNTSRGTPVILASKSSALSNVVCSASYAVL